MIAYTAFCVGIVVAVYWALDEGFTESVRISSVSRHAFADSVDQGFTKVARVFLVAALSLSVVVPSRLTGLTSSVDPVVWLDAFASVGSV